MPVHLTDAFPTEAWGVDIIVGPVPTGLDNPSRDEGFMQMAPGEFLALIDGVGRMHVTAERVTLEPEPGHDLREMDYLVYGWAPRWIRILRSEFALHASAVTRGERAIAVMGFSGAGKSTTVTELTRRGFSLIIDDVLPIDFTDGLPMVHGWPRPVHLTDEAAAHFGVSDEERVGGLTESKVSTTLPTVDGAWPLDVAIELEPREGATQVEVARLTGAAKVQAVLNHSNGVGFSAADGRAHDFFGWATRLCQTIEVYRVSRPVDGWHLDGVVDHVVSIIESRGATP